MLLTARLYSRAVFYEQLSVKPTKKFKIFIKNTENLLTNMIFHGIMICRLKRAFLSAVIFGHLNLSDPLVGKGKFG